MAASVIRMAARFMLFQRASPSSCRSLCFLSRLPGRRDAHRNVDSSPVFSDTHCPRHPLAIAMPVPVPWSVQKSYPSLIPIRNAPLKGQNHSLSFVLKTIRRTTSRISRTGLLAGPSGSSLRYASRSWSCIPYSPLRAWTSASIR